MATGIASWPVETVEIKVQDLKNVTVTLTIDKTKTILDAKRAYAENLKISMDDHDIKFIHVGKILGNDESVSKYSGAKFMCVCKRIEAATPARAPAPAPVRAPAPAPAHVPARALALHDDSDDSDDDDGVVAAIGGMGGGPAMGGGGGGGAGAVAGAGAGNIQAVLFASQITAYTSESQIRSMLSDEQFAEVRRIVDVTGASLSEAYQTYRACEDSADTAIDILST